MQTLIISDIFGRTTALENLASEFTGPVKIVDPYASEKMDFSDEAAAYQYFKEQVGLEAYAEWVRHTIANNNGGVSLVGFSVGASALWNISGDESMTNIIEAIGFYGSQIRFNSDVRPKFPMKLVFPSTEIHFSVAELIERLSSIENVTIEQCPYLHGFMNRHSNNFDLAGYKHGLALLQE